MPKANVLLNTYAFHEPWAQPWMSRLLEPWMKVTVVALSFNAGDTEEVAKTENHRQDLLPAFRFYGIPEENVRLVDWFHDNPITAQRKIASSQVLFFTGGWPEHMMYRLRVLELVEQIERFPGIIMGCSAGAMIQLKQYHITPFPEDGYPEFCYMNGMNLLKDFYIEVHYMETDLQHCSIQRVRQEKQKPVIALYNDGGLIVQEDCLIPMGRTRIFPV